MKYLKYTNFFIKLAMLFVDLKVYDNLYTKVFVS